MFWENQLRSLCWCINLTHQIIFLMCLNPRRNVWRYVWGKWHAVQHCYHMRTYYCHPYAKCDQSIYFLLKNNTLSGENQHLLCPTPPLYRWIIQRSMISYMLRFWETYTREQERRGSCEKMEEMEAFVSTFLTVGIGNSQMLSITTEGQRIDWPIYLMKRSRGGGGG